MDHVRDAFACQGLYRAEPSGGTAGRGTCSRPAREHLLSARSRSDLEPMYVRPDVERIVT